MKARGHGGRKRGSIGKARREREREKERVRGGPGGTGWQTERSWGCRYVSAGM